jgi:hypothetical protein
MYARTCTIKRRQSPIKTWINLWDCVDRTF